MPFGTGVARVNGACVVTISAIRWARERDASRPEQAITCAVFARLLHMDVVQPDVECDRLWSERNGQSHYSAGSKTAWLTGTVVS